jgi:hypothetical protein
MRREVGVRLAMRALLSAGALAFGAGAQAQALEILNPPIQVAAKKTQKAKKASGNKAKFEPGSQETVKQRRDRLTRECRGAVDAGACTGYTR